MNKQSRAEELKRKSRYWKKHIEAWRKSGMPQRAYCREHDLKFHQFVYWRKKFLSSNEPAISLVQISPPEKSTHRPVPSPKPVHLITVSGHRIELKRDFDPVALGQLIHALERL